MCTLCVLLTHSSYFDVFERSKLIAVLLVEMSVLRRKIEFSPDNLLVFFTVIMAYRMESMSISFFFFLRRIDVRTCYYCKNICKNFFEKLNFL